MNMKKILRVVPILLVFGLVLTAVSAPVLANAQEPAAVTPEERQARLDSEARQAMLAEIATQLEEAKQEALRLSLLVMKLELEQQALALEQQLQQVLTQGGTGIAITMPVPGSNAPEMVVEEPAAGGQASPAQFSEAPAGPADLGVEEDVNVFVSEEGVPADANALAGRQSEEEEEGRGFFARFGPLGNIGAPELAALAILIFLVAFTLMRRLRRARTVRSSSVQSAPLSSQPLPQSQQGMLQEGREDLKEKIAWE